jgi:putative endonuclease
MGYVYILASQRNGTLYIGVTSDLKKRIYEHKNHFVRGFTERYQVDQLVYYAVYDSIISAIASEKKLKNLSRKRKLEIIEAFNPDWTDLYKGI